MVRNKSTSKPRPRTTREAALLSPASSADDDDDEAVGVKANIEASMLPPTVTESPSVGVKNGNAVPRT